MRPLPLIVLALMSAFALAPVAITAGSRPAAAAGAEAVVLAPQQTIDQTAAAGRAQLRERAGPAWNVKSARADRVLAGQPAPGDLGALDAEAKARGLGETMQTVAAIHAGRRDRYLAGLARIDGARVRALLAIASGEPPTRAIERLDREIAAALAELPPVE
jgi:hypothetical protein